MIIFVTIGETLTEFWYPVKVVDLSLKPKKQQS